MALNDLKSFIELNNLAIQYSNNEILLISQAVPLIAKTAFYNKSLFDTFKYTLRYLNRETQEILLSKLLLLISEAYSQHSLFLFVTDIVIKVANESMMLEKYVNVIINYYLYSSHCVNSQISYQIDYLKQMIKIITLTKSQYGLDLLTNSLSKFNSIGIKTIYASEYLFDLLMLDNNKDSFITSIIKWKYDQRILSLMIRQIMHLFNSSKYDLLMIAIHKQLRLLTSINEKEQMDLALDPNKLMQGINIINGLSSKTFFRFPTSDFILEFSFRLNATANERNIFLLNFHTTNINHHLIFSIENMCLCFIVNSKKHEICNVIYEKTYHIYFKVSVPCLTLFTSPSIEVIVNNNEKFNFKKVDEVSGMIYLKIEGFNGQLGKLMIYPWNKNEDKCNINSILIYDPLLSLYQYQFNKGLTEFKFIKARKRNKLCQKINEDQNNFYEDIPFEYIPLKESFIVNEGIDYLLLLMNYLNTISRQPINEYSNAAKIYKCIKHIFQYVFNLEIHNNDKAYSLYYSFALLIPKVFL